ncbi:MAG: SRPBCC domain-containing protein, partial [Flavisolibacter sp.]|nr:SRPBCC domain-containing protein [Flavisolibacter sp.]
MTATERAIITIEAVINAPVEKVWELWTDPKHIMQWNNASDDWHTPKAENDLREGGRFLARMEAKDGSSGFDFGGQYTKVEKHKTIEYRIDDGRKVAVSFVPEGNKTSVTETFEAEETHSEEMQRTGWQSILDNFKRYAEKVQPMEKLHFEITINAPVDKVYTTMLDEKGYREWTVEFNPTSHFIGSWEKGAKIRFIGTDSNGVQGGMVSRIKENIPNQFISIEHLGLLQ